MSKKILKRSLALGALMAFVITGSAMAAVGDDFRNDYPTKYPGDSYGKGPYVSDTNATVIEINHNDKFESWYDFKDKPFRLGETYYPGKEELTGNKDLDAGVGFTGYIETNENNEGYAVSQERNKYSSYLNTNLNGFKLTINNQGSGYALSSSGYYKGINYVFTENVGSPYGYVYDHIYTNLKDFHLDMPGFNIYNGDLEIKSSSVAVLGYGKIDVDELKITSDSNAIQSVLSDFGSVEPKEAHKMEIYANSMEVKTKGNAIQVYNDLDIGSEDNPVGKLDIQGKDGGTYARAIRVAHSTVDGYPIGVEKPVANIYADVLNISGAAESSKVSNNGTLNLNANKGEIINDFEAASTGTINVKFGSGVNWSGAFDTADGATGNVTLNGATWKVTGDSSISTLAGNDGKIVLGLRNEPAAAAYSLRSTGNNNAFYGLQIGDLTNSGLEVSGGAELTEAIENGTVDMTAEEALQQLAGAVTVTGEDSQEKTVSKVTIEAGDTLGETTATITANGTIASITQDVNPKAAKVSKAATNLKAHYRAHMNDMNKRMGELRMANGEAGVWTRMVRGESEYEGAKMQYNQYQLGYDEKLSVDKRWTVGAAVTFAEGDGSYGQGSTDDKSTAFAIYGSKLNNDGTFVDLIARYAHLESDMEDSVYGNGDYSTNGYSVSAEFGKRIQQGNGLWVEPQVELTYGTVDSADFRLDKGYNAHFDSMDSFIARVGFSIGKDIKQGNVYARASYLYDFDGETTSLVTKIGIGTPTPEDFGGGWWEVGVGANINLSKATYIYADIEKTFGGEVDTNWQWNLGVRYSF